LKNKIWQACSVLEHADFDIAELDVEFDIDFREADSYGLAHDVTNISYNLLEEKGKVKITIE
jgi:hypothetical protein